MSSAPLPKQVKDADQGTILLSTGDFVVLQLQFRLGNDDTISKEWDALGTIEAIFLPYVPWNGVPAITQLPPLLPTVQSPTSVYGIPAIGHLLRVPLDQEAVRHYFADFWQHGKEVYMRTHFGAVRADLTHRTESAMMMMGDRLLRGIVQSRNLVPLVQRLREAGMYDTAAKFCEES